MQNSPLASPFMYSRGIEGADVGAHRQQQLLGLRVVLGPGGVRIEVQVVERQLQHVLGRIEERDAAVGEVRDHLRA